MDRALLRRHRSPAFLVLIAFLGLTACQTSPPPEQPVVTPVEENLTVKEYIRRGVGYLEVGNEIDAREDFVRALELEPDNRTAAFMLEQIDADPEAYLGRDYFPYTVRRGQVLSTIAKRFLGNSLKFYILARYNDIPNPSVIEVGQVLKIPGKPRPEPPPRPEVVAKPESEEAITTVEQPVEPEVQTLDEDIASMGEQGEFATQPAGTEPESVSASEPESSPGPDSSTEPVPPPEPETEQVATVAKPPVAPPEPDRQLVDQYHKQALILFREQQNLCGAIRAWDKVLALDPGHVAALTYKDKAQRMATKLNQSCR
ncbi:MAG: LysM peptidoglycan-binding domain-containing protein [Candidatus Competibacteraceae bacterium]